jgi:hypothetical protein
VRSYRLSARCSMLGFAVQQPPHACFRARRMQLAHRGHDVCPTRRRLQGSQVEAFSAHPGVIQTNLGRHMNGPAHWGMRIFMTAARWVPAMRAKSIPQVAVYLHSASRTMRTLSAEVAAVPGGMCFSDSNNELMYEEAYWSPRHRWRLWAWQLLCITRRIGSLQRDARCVPCVTAAAAPASRADSSVSCLHC